jgi:WD40 repeat protein
VSIDDGSIECLEFLSDGTYIAAGCSNGLIKIVSSSQSTRLFIKKMSSIFSRDRIPLLSQA